MVRQIGILFFFCSPFLGFRLVKETTILPRIPERWLVNYMRFQPEACQVVQGDQKVSVQLTIVL